tara:strand:+ start:2432 stop:4225 length:1794 start_codon:yes stop_codon:yes gene_type:complete
VLKILLASVLWCGLLLPFHLFPLEDLPNDVVSMLLASILFFFIVLKYRSQMVALPVSALLLLVFIISVIGSSFVQESSFLFSDYAYLIFLFAGVLVAVAAGTLKEHGNDVVPLIAKSLYWIALITATYGLLRHYGVLKLLLPWVTGETTRLLGPLNQANLTALVLGLGIISSVFLLISSRLRYPNTLLSVSYMSVAASLTGSRAFVIFVLLIIAIPMLKLCVSPRVMSASRRVVQNRWKQVVAIVGLVLVITFVFPSVSRPISDSLIQAGFIERGEEEAVSDRFRLTDDYRSEEWRKLQAYPQIAENPLFGFGPGRYGVFSIEADKAIEDPVRMGTLWSHGHNLFVNVFVELGIFGLSVMLAMVAYLFALFWRSEFLPRDYFVFSALGALFVNNMLEFSFWFFGFFALAIVLVSQVDRRVKIKFSSSFLPVSVGGALLVTSLVSFAYVGSDYWGAVKGFHKANLTQEERYAFLDAKKNRFVGGYALKAQIIREQVSLFGVEAQIRELERYMSWRPEMVFMMRSAVLKSVIGPQEIACDRVKETVGLYPNSVERLADELVEAKQLGATFDIAFIQGCLAEGMMYWVELSRNLPPEKGG